MKPHQSESRLSGQLTTPEIHPVDDQRKLKRIRKLLAATLKRFLGTGERLRARLGDEAD